jgi:DNA-binding transcriptional regulator WhiA
MHDNRAKFENSKIEYHFDSPVLNTANTETNNLNHISADGKQ